MEEKVPQVLPKDFEGQRTPADSSADDVTPVPLSTLPGPADDEQLSRKPSRLGQEGLLQKTLSRVRTKDSINGPGPPPDGGFRAWGHVLLVHLVIFVTWGNINGFGVFQYYYTRTLNESPSAIAWIGDFQTFLTFFCGTFSGRALDAGFYKLTFCIGLVTQAFGIFMTSICKTYWQLFLAQGLCQGLGNGLIFVPSVALLSTYFSKKRSLAIGLAAGGSSTGGMVFPAIVENLLPKIGFGWTVRVIGLVVLVITTSCAIFTRPRLPPRKSGPLVEWSAFNEGTYLLFAITAFLYFWGIYTGFFYVTSYARDILGVSEATSINVLLLMNGVGIITRIIPNYIADRYTGPLNVFFPAGLSSSILLYCWIAVHSVTGIWVFAGFYGLTGAAVQGMFPAVVTSLTKDQAKAGVRMGMLFSIVGFAVLTGPAICGALITKDGGNYLYAQLFSASSLVLGCCFLIAARYATVGWKLLARI